MSSPFNSSQRGNDDREVVDSVALLRLIDALALGTIVALAWRACRRKHRHRRATSSACTPAPVHTWEGEGGRPLPAEHAASGVTAGPRRPA